ncbi:glycosyltransferase family 1 protein [Peribacillus simplex]|uniref:glycosyltransferase family 4 protein n=1 Tax=Peribacillus simplex TaxID=1478 RepID=UPI000F62CA2D|nr:glycosyltransferase family 4 protein [Peribacillus simplex]RRN69917.1 glycosyltransferase family 1 protein [Peribacillus simplex]
MKVAISAIRTKDIRINRHELVTSLQGLGHSVIYLGQESNSNIHLDYEKYNVTFQSIPLGRSNTNPFREIKSIKETSRVLKENHIEALIVYGIRTFPTMVIAAKLAGVKKILCIVNGSGRLFQLQGINGLLVKCISYPMLWLSFLLSNSILFQNQDDMKMIKRKGLLGRRNYGVINGSGVNLDEYQVEELEKVPVFSMISRLTGSKGVNEYIRAACYVKQTYPESIFNLIGPMDDDDTSINMSELQKAVGNGTIILKGKVEDVRPFIKQCRVFVLPSYYPEGVPRSIIEAMAMGRPIITADSSGCRETVVDRINGFLVPPRDANTLAEKMIWMIENKEEVAEMGKNSRRICEDKFNVNQINKIMLRKMGLL